MRGRQWQVAVQAGIQSHHAEPAVPRVLQHANEREDEAVQPMLRVSDLDPAVGNNSLPFRGNLDYG
jgi:hypothetical protein